MITHEVVDLTPDLARELLATRPAHQRRVTKAHVRRLAEAMSTGAFLFTPQPVILDVNGALQDGQHRCLAVIEADVTVPIVISRGADPEVFPLIDTGKARQASQFIEGPNGTTIARAARIALSVRTGTRPSALNSVMTSWTNKQVLDEVERDAEYRAVADQISRIRKAARITPGPLLALHIIAGQHVDSDKCSLWLSGLETGEDLAKGDPRLALRNRFIQGPILSGGGNLPGAQFVHIVKAWNAWMLDSHVKVLRYRANEGMPTIIGATEHPLTPEAAA